MVEIGGKYVKPDAVIALDEWWDYAQHPMDGDHLRGTKIVFANDQAIYVDIPPKRVKQILDGNKFPDGIPKEETGV